MSLKKKNDKLKYLVRDYYPTENTDPKKVLLKYQQRIKVFIQRSPKEKHVMDIQQKLYIVPTEMSMLNFLALIRQRLQLPQEKALFFLINDRSTVVLSRCMGDVYNEFMAADGVLYITYAAEKCFG